MPESTKVSTRPGAVYSITCSGDCSVTTEVRGETITLATLSGGGQATFQAVSSSVAVSNPAAIILPFDGAPASLGHAGGMTEDAVAKVIASELHAALCDEATTRNRTIAGTGNAALHWCQLDERRVPAGRLQSISIPCRSTASAGVAQLPLYLVVWEWPADDSDWVMIGTSTDAVQQTINSTARWEFDNLELSGRAIRICAATEPDVWQDTQWLGVRMAAGESGEASKGVGSSQVNQVVDLTFETVEMVPKFAPVAHVEDADAHLSAEENRLLSGLRLGSPQGAIPALMIKGGDGSALLVMRGNQANVSVSCDALSFNVRRLMMTSDFPAIYSYDVYTGVTKVWFAVTQDAVSLAPLGLSEPGAYVGDASLPLCLRGSELRWNGSVIDVAALSELLARKDELLALLAAGQAQADDSGASG